MHPASDTLIDGSNVRSERFVVGGGARAVVHRRSGGACEGCGLEWPWALYLFLVDESSPARAANLIALCWKCSEGRRGRCVPLVPEPTLRERLRTANNLRTGAIKLTPGRRLRLIAARGGCCEICGVPGSERQLQVHHRLAVLRGGDDSEANLLVLCFACHHHLQPCARGCGRWTKKPNTVCRHCWTEERVSELQLEWRRSTREPMDVSTS
ncbi:MAG TPA: HNH endonuclease signature motif containing protein [Candidatus Dormibacteraeota bacterium]|nr:HNH endonuclease signature motif containing protein [Candidatus Dormibacteraeota bacterium]